MMKVLCTLKKAKGRQKSASLCFFAFAQFSFPFRQLNRPRTGDSFMYLFSRA